MSGIFSRATEGQPLRIPANAYNAAMDAAEEFARKGRPTGGGPVGGGSGRHRLVVTIKNVNDEDEDLDAFDTLTVPTAFSSATLATILDQEYQVNESPMLNGYYEANGAAPRDSLIVIVQESIPFNEFGRAVIQGVTIANVDVQNTAHDFADYDGTSKKLTSSTSGRVRILEFSAATPATGEQLCLVHVQQSTQKLASYTALPSYDVSARDSDTIDITTAASGYTVLHTASFPVGWYTFKIHGNGFLSGTTSGFAALFIEKDIGFGFNSILPATTSSRMATATGTIQISTPFSMEFLHYVSDATDDYRLRVFVNAGAETFTGIASWTTTPSVRHANMTITDPP